jgi:SAM-dependent methyltransferase
MSIIEAVRSNNGKVLDCGAGLRSEIDETVVTLEVVEYPGIDVVATNQSIPFQDEVFDAVLSLNVLEHVTDPFQSASELVRVLKPGGRIYCVVPFLQPEHGYPDHYFNMTRSGIRRLFPERMSVEQQIVPKSGHPIWTLHWFLSWYMEHLAGPAKEKFSNLRVSDLLRMQPEQWLEDDIARSLSVEGTWKLAATTALVLEKKA